MRMSGRLLRRHTVIPFRGADTGRGALSHDAVLSPALSEAPSVAL